MLKAAGIVKIDYSQITGGNELKWMLQPIIDQD